MQGGDGPADIASTLADAGVVASAEAFEAQAAKDADVQALRPGYYRVRQNASAQAAADALVAAENHVGHVRLIPGRQLADVTATSTDPNQPPTVVPGYISEITAAACVPLNGQSNCFTTDELWEVAETADPAKLGVVEWAADSVRAAPDPRKRLEGMMLPGDFDIPPGATPEQALQAVVSASAALWNGTDIVRDAAANGVTPYQAAIIASLVEREAITADMPKVSRVTFNRLAKPMNLEFDSTVNYALDRASIATTAVDRANPSPVQHLCEPGAAADADLVTGSRRRRGRAEPGPWFVAVLRQGRSERAVLLQRHRRAAQRLCGPGTGQRCLRLSRRRAGDARPCSARRCPIRCPRRCTGRDTRPAGSPTGRTRRSSVTATRCRRWLPRAGPEWAGFSVTMPGKAAAAAVADEASARVRTLGVANTLVRRDGGWFAENTDVDGIIGGLRAAGARPPRTALILGGGGTAASVVAALAELGTSTLVIAGRRPESTASAVELGRALGIRDHRDRLGRRAHRCRRGHRRSRGLDRSGRWRRCTGRPAQRRSRAVRRRLPPVADAVGRGRRTGPGDGHRPGHVAASGFTAVRVDDRAAGARRGDAPGVARGVGDGSACVPVG